MADWAGIGQMLQGIGAGFQGKGAEYLAAKAAEDENAFLNDERRREAFVKDMVYTNAYAQAGNWDAVTKRLSSRLDGIKTLKGNDFHTKGLLEMAADPARREEFLNETNAFIQAAVMARDIELPVGGNEGAKRTDVFKNGSVLQATSDGGIRLTVPSGQSIMPGQPGWQVQGPGVLA